MVATAEANSLLFDEATFAHGSIGQPAEVVDLRRRGRARFEAVGIPTTREEEWRLTNLAPISKTSFCQASDITVEGLTVDKLQPFKIPECLDLVFINGRFSVELSETDEIGVGVVAGSLAEALVATPELVLPHLGHHADLDHPFVALNTANLVDGAFIHIPRGIKVPGTLHLLFITTGGEQPVACYPRNLIVVGEGAELSVVESYSGFGGERYLTCSVTEIVGQASSTIDHYRLGQESLDAFHLGTLKIHLERDSQHFTHSMSHGGGIVRNDIQAYLGGEGIHCTLNGLYLAREKQLVDHHMWVDHAKPHCNSFELFKGILEDRSRAVFNGRIVVHQDAQKTDAKQSSQHLLLSDEAIAYSNPQLEIYADDVKCTHGSTTGHLDDDALFYLRSRGIGEDAARSLLTYAFAGEVLDEIRLETVRKDFEEFLFSRLPKGDIVRQAV